jgi:hypothetical protein
VAVVAEAAAGAGAVVMVEPVAARDQTLILRRKARAGPNPPMSVGPVASLVTGPRSVGPRGRKRARPTWLKRRKVGFCWLKPMNLSWERGQWVLKKSPLPLFRFRR